MSDQEFFNNIRPFFGGSMSQPQVTGMQSILDAARKYGVTDRNHIANIMAQVYHETGKYMSPIKETVFESHKDKNPSDDTVIKRLDTAFARGQLPWVKTPYWRDGWFGRGQVQITHKDNYKRLGDRLGVNLVANPDLALDPRISAEIAVVGMKEGLFTGKKLSDYNFPAALSAAPANNPRRIVNGQDGTDAKIAGYHKRFYDALSAGSVAEPTPTPQYPEEPQPQAPLSVVIGGIIVVALAAITKFFGVW